MHSVAYHELRLPLMRNASDYDDLEEFMWEADIRSLRQDDSDFTPRWVKNQGEKMREKRKKAKKPHRTQKPETKKNPITKKNPQTFLKIHTNKTKNPHTFSISPKTRKKQGKTNLFFFITSRQKTAKKVKRINKKRRKYKDQRMNRKKTTSKIQHNSTSIGTVRLPLQE